MNGFCIFNNAAQAAEAAFNYGADRILIVDLDVHHGQGTQRIFYDDKRVLYYSVHRFEFGKYWPHLEESNFNCIGKDEGKGYNVNIPLNEKGCGDADYLAAFWNVLYPIAMEFDPHFVIVSAGFDSCYGDPLGGMNLSPNCYSQIIYQLKAFAEGKLLVILEGGYNYSVLSAGVYECLRVLAGRKPKEFIINNNAKESTISSCLNAISMLRPYWSCFDFYAVNIGENGLKWNHRNPTVEFDPPSEDDRPADTTEIKQEELENFDFCNYKDFTGELSTFLISDELSELHFDSIHPTQIENSKRTTAIMDKITSCGLLNQCTHIRNQRAATETELEAAHERPFIKRIMRTQQMSDSELREEEKNYNSIFLASDTANVARRAAGATLEAVDIVLGHPHGQCNVFAIVRPPGHHAGFTTPGGFCIFNNVAVAASYAMSKYSLDRVLILDWDVHHGNGTQEIFYEDPRVLYISLHRHEDGLFFPMGEPKDYMDVGIGKGVGRTVNIPWNYGCMGDLEYRTAFSKIVMPIASSFSPQLVLISAGFDASTGDPLGEYKVSPSTYALMTHQLAGLAGGHIVVVLEGGYNIEAISEGAIAVLETLISSKVRRRLVEEREHYATKKPKLHPEAWVTLRRVAQTQEKYWNLLRGFEVQGEHLHVSIPNDTSSSDSDIEEKPGVVENSAREKEMGSSALGSNEHCGLYSVVPLSSCVHLEKVTELPTNGVSHSDLCTTCQMSVENWACLTCYKVHCGRHINEHALMHYLESEHPMALSLADLSVWCYPCDSYVHNEILIPAKNSAHVSKFGAEIPRISNSE